MANQKEDDLSVVEKRAAENELRARDLEAQGRLIEARLRLADMQKKMQAHYASKKK